MSHSKSLSKIARSKRVAKRSAKPERMPSASTGNGTKQKAVLTLLRELQGTTIVTIMKATGWEPHSVRGFLTAVVRTKLGLTVLSEKPGEEPDRTHLAAMYASNEGQSTDLPDIATYFHLEATGETFVENVPAAV